MAFVLSMPKLANVGAILGLMLFLYTVLGVTLFAKVREYPGGMNSDSAIIRSFFRAFTTLVRFMTGESWNELMHSYGKDKF